MIGSIQYSNDFDVHIALIVAPSYEKTQREKYYSDGKPPAQICREYIDLFGFMQKNPNALDILIEESKIRLRTWGWPMPDFLLTNSKLCFQLQMTPERTNYLTQGPDGVKRLKQGPEVSSYRGLKIINTRAFSLEVGQVPRDILRRRVRVAEYYRITPSAGNMNREFEFYNEARDNWFSLTFLDLLNMARYKETHLPGYNLPGEGNADRIKQVIKFLQNPPEDEVRGAYAYHMGPIYQESQQYVSRLEAPNLSNTGQMIQLAKIINDVIKKKEIIRKFQEEELFIDVITPISGPQEKKTRYLIFASYGLRGGVRFNSKDPLFKILNDSSRKIERKQLFADSFQIYPMSDPWQAFLNNYEMSADEKASKAKFYDEIKLKRLLFYHYAVPFDSEGSDSLLYPVGAFLEPNHASFFTFKFLNFVQLSLKIPMPEIALIIFSKLFFCSELLDYLLSKGGFENWTGPFLILLGSNLVKAFFNNKNTAHFNHEFVHRLEEALTDFKIATGFETDRFGIWTVPQYGPAKPLQMLSDYPCEPQFNNKGPTKILSETFDSRKLTFSKLTKLRDAVEKNEIDQSVKDKFHLCQDYQLDSLVDPDDEEEYKLLATFLYYILSFRLNLDAGLIEFDQVNFATRTGAGDCDYFDQSCTVIRYDSPVINVAAKRGITDESNLKIFMYDMISPPNEIIFDKIKAYIPPSVIGSSSDGVSDIDPSSKSLMAQTEIVIIRPNIEHYMLGIIMGLGGDQLGNTLWGQTELSVYDDSMHGVWGMSYKYHERAIVFNEKNLVRLWDVAYDGYNGGKEEKHVNWTLPDEVEKFKDDTMEVTKNYQGASMMVMAFVHESKSDLTKKFQRNWPSPILFDDNYDYVHDTSGPRPALVGYDNLHVVDTSEFRVFNQRLYSAFGEYRKMFPDFHQLHQTRKSAGESSRENETISDSLAFQGTMRIKENGVIKTEIAGSGHHGPDFTGVASIRAGKGYKMTGTQPTLGRLI